MDEVFPAILCKLAQLLVVCEHVTCICIHILYTYSAADDALPWHTYIGMGSLLLCNTYIYTYEQVMLQKQIMHYLTNANELFVVVTANEAASHLTNADKASCYKSK